MKVQVSACVHQEDPRVLEAWLEGLAGLNPCQSCDGCSSVKPQIWDEDCPGLICGECGVSSRSSVELSYKFVLHNPIGYEAEIFERILPDSKLKVIKTTIPCTEASDHTHAWHKGVIEIVSKAKNDLIHEALDSGADYLFFCDSDQVLQPPTLAHLLEQEKDLIGCISWCKWTPDGPELPNAWMRDHYTMDKDSLEMWRKPGIYKVGFVGGCLLIHRKVLEAGVSYIPIPNLSFKMEDRWFGIRAAVAGFQMWVSTHYPYLHLYRSGDLDRLEAWREKTKVL